MRPDYEHELELARSELQAAQAELDELEEQIHSFEAQVDSYLGGLLDQLGSVNIEINALNEALHQIREQNLYGKDRIRNLGGTNPSSSQFHWDDIPVTAGFLNQPIPDVTESTAPPSALPDIKHLYRLLARRYHPDLARSEAERQNQNEMMVEINQYYRENNLEKLMDLAGMEAPFYLRINKTDKSKQPSPALSDLERIRLELTKVEGQIARLAKLPSVKLSLDVKLARLQGRDLLAEMATNLKRKLERRLAERDYLRAQIHASGEFPID